MRRCYSQVVNFLLSKGATVSTIMYCRDVNSYDIRNNASEDVHTEPLM